MTEPEPDASVCLKLLCAPPSPRWLFALYLSTTFLGCSFISTYAAQVFDTCWWIQLSCSSCHVKELPTMCFLPSRWLKSSSTGTYLSQILAHSSPSINISSLTYFWAVLCLISRRRKSYQPSAYLLSDTIHIGLREWALFLGLSPKALLPFLPGSFAPKYFSLLICYKASGPVSKPA